MKNKLTKEEILNKYLHGTAGINEIEYAMEEYAAQSVRIALEELLPEDHFFEWQVEEYLNVNHKLEQI